MRRFHLPALGGLFATIGGILVAVAHSPEVLQSVPGKAGVIVATLGTIIQAVTKPIQK